MSRVPKVLLTVALALTSLAGSTEGAMRKCSVTPSGLPVVLQESQPIVMLNGVVLESNALSLGADGVAAMGIFCLDLEEDGQKVGRQVIAVVTRAGAADFMTRYLEDLVAAQEAYRAAHGHYTSLAVLGFYTTRPQFPIQISTVEDRWTATMRFDDWEGSCEVSWSATPEGGLLSEGVSCR